MSNHLNLGNEGENWACEFLTDAGYEILTRNYRYGRAEIDIVARKGDLLIFVEVKTRTNLSYGEPEAAVSRGKINRLKKAAEQYIYEANWMHDIRFDIIAIWLEEEREIQHLQDAFW